MSQKTGILFFARTPEAEAKAKSWTPSFKKNFKLAKALFENTQSILESTGISIFHVDNHQQKGTNFNERISNALTDFYNHGFENAIVVGSDCLELSVEDVLIARTNIDRGISTVGESKSGGVYLFTLSKKDFDPLVLEELPWCSKSLKVSLIELFRSNNARLASLTARFDLNHELQSVSTILKGKFSSLLRLIAALLNFAPAYSLHSKLHKFLVFSNLSRRGPPYLI